MTRDFLEAYLYFRFPTPDLLWCILPFYVSHLHLWHLLGDRLPLKVTTSLIVDLVRSLHRCWNLETKLVSHTPLFILHLGHYHIPFDQGEQYPRRKGWIVITFSHCILGELNWVDFLEIL